MAHSGEFDRPSAMGAGRASAARGALHVCVQGEGSPEVEEQCRHTSVFVNTGGTEYLEDNDIRGFLDGCFKWGWNQAEQSKVRLGRERSSIRPPKYGEDELYRVLHRWTGLELPDRSRITGASLIVHPKTPLSARRDVYLYRALRDWNPGRGGVRGDNVSVPREGEVWWRDARYGRESWGLPGAGFAARGVPDADTDVEPLARERCPPGTREIEFEGDRLASYVDDRLGKNEPLLFLLKLSDRQEDESGTIMALHSAEHGQHRSGGLRPRLRLEWKPGDGARCTQEDVFLEPGRQRTLRPCGMGEDGSLWVNFETDDGFEAPTVQYREVQSPADGTVPVTDWKSVEAPVRSGTGWVELRVVAARNPVALGDSYRARLRDTWVVSAPPEDQRIVWTFNSPNGESHEVPADYLGDFTWHVEFTPGELGRWRVHWEHELSGSSEEGPTETFDVIPDDLTAVRNHVRRLTARVSDMPRSGPRKERELARFARLERAAMQMLDPTEYRSQQGKELRRELKEAREALWGRSVPESIPMESHPLRTEVAGRRLEEPIPENDDYFRHEEYGGRTDSPADRVESWASRLLGWMKSAGRRVRALLSGPRRTTESLTGGDE